MRDLFRDRIEAGQLLAGKLLKYANLPGILVLGIPRGGVPVAGEVASRLSAPLHAFVVRKLGIPGHEETGMGAIATGGVRVLNARIIESIHIPENEIDAVAAKEQRELARRERVYRDDSWAADVEGRTAILVDDGIATGSTMLAAIAALRKLKASRIVVATPTIATTTYFEMAPFIDEIVAVNISNCFHGVGEWYEDFSQTSDEDVCEVLARARARSRA